MIKAKQLLSCVLGLSMIVGSYNPTIASSVAVPIAGERIASATGRLATPAAATFVATFAPSKDNTLYEDLDGALSNGAGQYFFVGNTNQTANATRRGLIKFDLVGIPPFVSVVSATLYLTMSQTVAGPQPVRLHRALADWGEGDSKAGGMEGAGGSAAVGDATWIHSFYTTTLWATPGGDFVITATATTTVGAVGGYRWTSPSVVSDVESWLNSPATNYGWLLTGNEGSPMTAKRFNTKEHPSPSARPLLVVTYTVPHAAYLPIALGPPPKSLSQ